MPAEEVFHVQVFAPGALRALPWLALMCSTPSVGERVVSVCHLAHLDVSQAPDGLPRQDGDLACYCAHERSDGDTSFGEAAIATLRAAFPPQHNLDRILGKAGDVAALARLAPTLAGLRLYGLGHSYTTDPSTAVLRLGELGMFNAQHTFGLHLGRCDDIELWACTAGGGDLLGVLRDDDDRLPQLAGHFIACGARGVLDLAWPIPDLVKALLCEVHGVLRRTRVPFGGTALRLAVSIVQQLLLDTAQARSEFASVGDLLRHLDEGRARFAAAQGLDATIVVPFARCESAPSLSGLSLDEVLEMILQPSNLAAPRWWGT